MYDVIVVGLGALGSAAAWQLAARGLRVLGLDRFRPPHDIGSSHGQSRIIRSAYFEDPAYVPLVQRAQQLWGELQQRSGRRLLAPTGGLMIGRPGGRLVEGALRSARQHGLRHQVLDAAELRRRHPQFRVDPDMVAVFEPDAGVLFPDACIEAQLQLAAQHGATLGFDQPVRGWRAVAAGVEVETTDGHYRTRRLLLAAGAWIGDLVPALADRFEVERQVMAWFDPVDAGSAFDPDRCPVHLWESAPGRYFYGMPDFGDGAKLAIHHEGERSHPERLRRTVDAADLAPLQALAERHVPALRGMPRAAQVCMYTNTADRHFWIAPLDEQPAVWIASACSGHGFKFACALGEVLADLLCDIAPAFELRLFGAR